MNESSRKGRKANGLDKYGIDTSLDGSLRRSKEKKTEKQKTKIGNEKIRNENVKKEMKNGRSRLAFTLDNSNRDCQVRITTTLVANYGPTKDCPFEVLPGDKVIARYRKGDNIKISRSDGLAGFVPVRICYLVAEESTIVQQDRNGSSRSVKSISPISPSCNGYENGKRGMKNSNLPLSQSPESSREQEIVKGREADLRLAPASTADIGCKKEVSKDESSDVQGNDCDSLARKVRRHEIRQLLKRETSVKLMSNAGKVNNGKKEALDSKKVLKPAEKNICPHEMGNALKNSNEVLRGLQNSCAVQSNNSNVSLNSSMDMKRQEKEKNLATSNNSIQREFSQKVPSGSNHSLNSLKSKGIVTNKQNMNLLNKENQQGDPKQRLGSIAVQVRTDNQSLCSYESSFKGSFSRLNGELSSAYNQLDGRFLYQRNDSPSTLTDSGMNELLFKIDHFNTGRRCSSLRGGANYAWLSNRQSNGYGDGCNPEFADNDRGLRHFAESGSAPASRVMSPSQWSFQHSLIMQEGGIAVDEKTTMFAMRDFKAVEKDELSLRKGERVTLMRKECEDWWWVLNKQGFGGLVPSFFLIPLLQPSQQSLSEILNDSSLSLSNSSYGGISSHFLPQMKRLENRRRTESMIHSSVENYPKPVGLMRSNTIGSDFRGHKGSRIDWRKVYNNEDALKGNSRLKEECMGGGNGSDAKSKEELLRRIRNEVVKDPMKDYMQKKTLSNENVHKISMLNGRKEAQYMNGVIQGSESYYERADKEEICNLRQRENANKHSESFTKNTQESRGKKELPSYDQCMHQISRDQMSISFTHSECSELCETPRILRRCRTFSGVASKKFKSNGNGNEEKSKIASEKGMKVNENTDDGLSTWC